MLVPDLLLLVASPVGVVFALRHAVRFVPTRFCLQFKDIAKTHGREDIGVVFCGAPLIAAALKKNCEKYSKKDGTIFRLQ